MPLALIFRNKTHYLDETNIYEKKAFSKLPFNQFLSIWNNTQWNNSHYSFSLNVLDVVGAMNCLEKG